MSDTSKTTKIIKRWYHSPSHGLTVNVLLNDISFLWFLLFSMCHSLHVAVNNCINWCYVQLYLHLYYTTLCWWSIMNHLLYTVMKTLNLKYFGVTILIFRGHVTSSERDHRTRREHFPIGGQWWPWIYLAQIWKYGASEILGSRVWPFGVMWRHRSRDHWTRHMWFPIGGPLELCIYLAPLRRYGPQRYWSHDLDLFGVTWRHRSRDHRTRRGHFPIGGQWWIPSPHCLFSIQLLWCYDDD